MGYHVRMCATRFENSYPIKFPFPRSGERDPYFFEARTRWYELAVPCKANGFRPPVKSVVDLKPGNVKGRRFIVFESARQYFERLARNGNVPAQVEESVTEEGSAAPHHEARKRDDSLSETAKLARLRDREMATRNANRPA